MTTDEKMLRLERDYTDEQILLEARRRGLLMRVDAESVVPAHVLADGYPLEEQIGRTMERAADEATRLFLRTGGQPRGMAVDMVRDAAIGWPHEQHRRVRIPLNIVVERQPK